MRVLFVIEPGRAPSTRLRLTDCIEYYRNAGIETAVLSSRRSSVRERTKIMREARNHDVVVLFKTTSLSPLELALLKRANRNVIFDFDDAVMFRGQKHRQALREKDFRKFVRTLKHCRAAVAGNHFLAALAEACGCPTAVLPTCVDLQKYRLKKHSAAEGLTIGWLGLSDGFAYLRDIQPALQQLTRQFPGLKLKIVSDKPL